MNRFPIGRDILERVLATFGLTVLALATADGVDWTDWGSVDNWKTWGVAGIAAAFSLIKGLIATRVGGRSASLDPAVKLAPSGGSSPVSHH